MPELRLGFALGRSTEPALQELIDVIDGQGFEGTVIDRQFVPNPGRTGAGATAAVVVGGPRHAIYAALLTIDRHVANDPDAPARLVAEAFGKDPGAEAMLTAIARKHGGVRIARGIATDIFWSDRAAP